LIKAADFEDVIVACCCVDFIFIIGLVVLGIVFKPIVIYVIVLLCGV
jgi:hypothetical protein